MIDSRVAHTGARSQSARRYAWSASGYRWLVSKQITAGCGRLWTHWPLHVSVAGRRPLDWWCGRAAFCLWHGRRTLMTMGGWLATQPLQRLTLQLFATATLAWGMVPPNNTWETVPIFWHSANKSGPLNPATLDFIAEHPFAMVTLEKNTMLEYPPLNSSGEAKLIQQAKWIKQRAPDKAVMFCKCAAGSRPMARSTFHTPIHNNSRWSLH
jgi:hypothetical protein